jgi:NADPH:quinone reductase-like Zn-dependent oxidoreductase
MPCRHHVRGQHYAGRLPEESGLVSEQQIIFTARECAELLPAEPDPSPLGPKEVRGRTLATLVSAGTELNGGYLGQRFPSEPGYAAVFQVEEVGSEVTGITPGDRAYCSGRHRSFQRASLPDVLRVPDGISPAEATFGRLMGVSMSTLTTTKARPPETVLVTGLGLVGHLAALVFRACGYGVIVSDPSPARRALAERSGLPDVRDAVPVDDPALAGKIALTLECSGHEAAVVDACRLVRKGGEVAMIGAPWRQLTDLSAHSITNSIFHRYVTLRSGWEWELPLHGTEFRSGNIWENYRAAMDWLADGRVRVSGLYETAPPEDAQRVFQSLMRQEWPTLAAVFNWE